MPGGLVFREILGWRKCGNDKEALCDSLTCGFTEKNAGKESE